MDWMAVYLVVAGIGLIVVVAVFTRAAYMRMTGRRSRFDAIAETLVRSQNAGVYPPALRGDPMPAVVEEVEDSRAVRAEDATPADEEEISRTQ